MSALPVGAVTTPDGEPAALFRPQGKPVENGRVALARYRRALLPDGPATTLQCRAQFGGVLWLAPLGTKAPALSGHVERHHATVDARVRVTIPADARAVLGLPPALLDAFAVLADLAPEGGVYLCPLDGYEWRKGRVPHVGS